MIDHKTEIARICLNIQALRQKNKLTVQELAYRCNFERSNMSRIEAGKTNITIKTLCTVCNALGVCLRDVIY